MAISSPNPSKTKVDEAGEALVQDRSDESAIEVIGRWRTLHLKPLQTFHVSLEKAAQTAVSGEKFVVRRLKRMEAIRDKLTRNPTQLSQMQDIAGCRAVVNTIEEVDALVQVLIENNKEEHDLMGGKPRNYIQNPTKEGYRGVHLVYAHGGADPDSAGVLSEIQVRSRMQHVWATTVETAGLFLKHNLKAGDGPEDWLNYFAMVGRLFAIEESGIQSGLLQSFREDLKKLHELLGVESQLQTFNTAIQISENESGKYGDEFFYLLVLRKPDPKKQGAMLLRVEAYVDPVEAADSYIAAERQVAKERSIDAVLVTAQSLSELREAYPNYYGLTEEFLKTVNRLLER